MQIKATWILRSNILIVIRDIHRYKHDDAYLKIRVNGLIWRGKGCFTHIVFDIGVKWKESKNPFALAVY